MAPNFSALFLHLMGIVQVCPEERLWQKQDKEASGKHEQTIKRTVATLHEKKKKNLRRTHWLKHV